MLLLFICFTFVLSFSKRKFDLLSTTNIRIPKEEEEITFINFKRKGSTEDMICSEISCDDMNCNYDYNCTRSLSYLVECSVSSETKCKGPRTFNKSVICQYCWQLHHESYFCTKIKNCISGVENYRSTCKVKDDTLCLGNRKFHKTETCKFTSGKIWLMAILFSIFLGGLGVDRCYLGYWGWAFLKFCSCGGLCVWTILDTLLIVGYVLGPSDGSIYWQ